MAKKKEKLVSDDSSKDFSLKGAVSAAKSAVSKAYSAVKSVVSAPKAAAPSAPSGGNVSKAPSAPSAPSGGNVSKAPSAPSAPSGGGSSAPKPAPAAPAPAVTASPTPPAGVDATTYANLNADTKALLSQPGVKVDTSSGGLKVSTPTGYVDLRTEANQNYLAKQAGTYGDVTMSASKNVAIINAGNKAALGAGVVTQSAPGDLWDTHGGTTPAPSGYNTMTEGQKLAAKAAINTAAATTISQNVQLAKAGTTYALISSGAGNYGPSALPGVQSYFQKTLTGIDLGKTETGVPITGKDIGTSAMIGNWDAMTTRRDQTTSVVPGAWAAAGLQPYVPGSMSLTTTGAPINNNGSTGSIGQSRDEKIIGTKVLVESKPQPIIGPIQEGKISKGGEWVYKNGQWTLSDSAMRKLSTEFKLGALNPPLISKPETSTTQTGGLFSDYASRVSGPMMLSVYATDTSSPTTSSGEQFTFTNTPTALPTLKALGITRTISPSETAIITPTFGGTYESPKVDTSKIVVGTPTWMEKAAGLTEKQGIQIYEVTDEEGTVQRVEMIPKSYKGLDTKGYVPTDTFADFEWKYAATKSQPQIAAEAKYASEQSWVTKGLKYIPFIGKPAAEKFAYVESVVLEGTGTIKSAVTREEELGIMPSWAAQLARGSTTLSESIISPSGLVTLGAFKLAEPAIGVAGKLTTKLDAALPETWKASTVYKVTKPVMTTIGQGVTEAAPYVLPAYFGGSAVMGGIEAHAQGTPWLEAAIPAIAFGGLAVASLPGVGGRTSGLDTSTLKVDKHATRMVNEPSYPGGRLALDIEATKAVQPRMMDIEIVGQKRVLDVGAGFRPVKGATDFVDAGSYKENLNESKYKVADYNKKLPYEDGTFETIKSRASIGSYGKQTAFDEAYRVLKPSGQTDFELVLRQSQLDSITSGKPDSLMIMMKKAGFENVRYERVPNEGVTNFAGETEPAYMMRLIGEKPMEGTTPTAGAVMVARVNEVNPLAQSSDIIYSFGMKSSENLAVLGLPEGLSKGFVKDYLSDVIQEKIPKTSPLSTFEFGKLASEQPEVIRVIQGEGVGFSATTLENLPKGAKEGIEYLEKTTSKEGSNQVIYDFPVTERIEMQQRFKYVPITPEGVIPLIGPEGKMTYVESLPMVGPTGEVGVYDQTYPFRTESEKLNMQKVASVLGESMPGLTKSQMTHTAWDLGLYNIWTSTEGPIPKVDLIQGGNEIIPAWRVGRDLTTNAEHSAFTNAIIYNTKYGGISELPRDFLNHELGHYISARYLKRNGPAYRFKNFETDFVGEAPRTAAQTLSKLATTVEEKTFINDVISDRRKMGYKYEDIVKNNVEQGTPLKEAKLIAKDVVNEEVTADIIAAYGKQDTRMPESFKVKLDKVLEKTPVSEQEINFIPNVKLDNYGGVISPNLRFAGVEEVPVVIREVAAEPNKITLVSRRLKGRSSAEFLSEELGIPMTRTAGSNGLYSIPYFENIEVKGLGTTTGFLIKNVKGEWDVYSGGKSFTQSGVSFKTPSEEAVIGVGQIAEYSKEKSPFSRTANEVKQVSNREVYRFKQTDKIENKENGESVISNYESISEGIMPNVGPGKKPWYMIGIQERPNIISRIPTEETATYMTTGETKSKIFETPETKPRELQENVKSYAKAVSYKPVKGTLIPSYGTDVIKVTGGKQKYEKTVIDITHEEPYAILTPDSIKNPSKNIDINNIKLFDIFKAEEGNALQKTNFPNKIVITTSKMIGVKTKFFKTPESRPEPPDNFNGPDLSNPDSPLNFVPPKEVFYNTQKQNLPILPENKPSKKSSNLPSVIKKEKPDIGNKRIPETSNGKMVQTMIGLPQQIELTTHSHMYQLPSSPSFFEGKLITKTMMREKPLIIKTTIENKPPMVLKETDMIGKLFGKSEGKIKVELKQVETKPQLLMRPQLFNPLAIGQLKQINKPQYMMQTQTLQMVKPGILQMVKPETLQMSQITQQQIQLQFPQQTQQTTQQTQQVQTTIFSPPPTPPPYTPQPELPPPLIIPGLFSLPGGFGGTSGNQPTKASGKKGAYQASLRAKIMGIKGAATKGLTGGTTPFDIWSGQELRVQPL